MNALAERTVSKAQIEILSSPSAIELTPVQYDKETFDKWTEWLEDPDVGLWMIGDFPHTPDAIDSWLYNATHDPKRHYFSINADGNMIGIINLRQDHMPENTGEIGIVIGELKNRGKGIGKEALKKMVDYAKDTVHLDMIRAHIKPENEKSIRLFTGQGFTYTQKVTISGTPMLRFEKTLNGSV